MPAITFDPLAASFDLSPDPLLICDSENRILSWNRCAAETFGWSTAEAVGQIAHELLQTVFPETFTALRDRLLREGTEACELEHTTRDGRRLTVTSRWLVQHAEGQETRLLQVHRDITDRKQVEDKFETQHARLQALIESSDGPIFAIDRQYCYTAFNTHHAKMMKIMFGVDVSIGCNLLELHRDPAERNLAKSNLDRTLNGETVIVEHNVGDNNFERRRFNIIHNPIYGARGTVTGVAIYAQDLTHRIAMEDALRDSEQRFRQLYEHLPIPYQSLDAEGRILEANDAWLAELGYGRAAVIGHAFADFLDDESALRFPVRFRQFQADGLVRGVEFGMRRADGETILVSFEGRIARNEQGAFLRSHCVFTNITERRRAERALRESEEARRALVDALPDIVQRFDRDGHHLFVSRNVETVSDIPAERFIGKTHRELGFPEPMCRFWDAAIRQVVQTGAPAESEFTYDGPHGPMVFNWRHVPEFEGTDRVKSVLSVARDITAGRRAEQDYQTLFREMLDGFAVHEILCDADGRPNDYRFLAVNPAFEHLTGMKGQDLVGKTVLEVLPGLERRWIDIYGRVALTGEPAHFEDYIQALDKYYEVTAFRPAPGQFACIFVDVTERRRNEDSLRESRADLNRAQAVAHTGSWRLDLRYGRLRWSDEACRIFEVPEDQEMTYERFLTAVHPDDRAYVDTQWQAALGGALYDIEHRIVVNGAVKWVRERAELECDVHGTLQSGFGTVTDITSRKQAETALRESEERFRQVAESAGEWIWEVDAEGCYTYASAAVERILGYTPEELVGKKRFYDLFTPQARAALLPAVHEAFARREPLRRVENANLHKNGRVVILETSGLPRVGANGELLGYRGTDMDVTERKQVEEALSRSEIRYRMLYENNLDGILLTEANGSIISANPQTCRMLGMTEVEIIAAGREGLVVADDKLAAALAERERTGRAQAELTMRRKDGTIFPCEIASSVFIDPDGTRKASMVVRDITERKRALDKLAESEWNLNRAQRVAKVGSWVWNILADTVEWSDEMYRIFGIDKASFSGSLSEVITRAIHPDDVASVEACNRMVIDENTPVPLEYRVVCPDGTIRTVWAEAGELVTDANGRPVRLTGIVQDITERKRTEEALRNSEAQYRNLIDFLPTGVLVHRNGRVLFANRKIAQIAGLASPEQFVGRNVMEFVPPDDRPAMIQRIQASLTSGQQAELRRERLIRDDGVEFMVEATGLPIDLTDGPAMLVVMDDITEKLEAEEARATLTQQLRQSQKMEAVGRLAGGVAHDFNNLLTVITGHAEMALLQLRPGDPLRPDIEEISHSAQRAANLTRQLLAFSRRQVMAPVVLNVSDTVAAMDRMLKRIIGEQIQLKTGTVDELWRIKADPGQMEQVIANLVVNAHDAMPRGGLLAIETVNIQIDAEFNRWHPELTPGPYVLLAVTDTGVGMSAEVMARIFEPFFTTKPMGEGTGLGLATVYGIVKQSGGHVLVESEVGSGTTFSIYLPAVMDAPTDVAAEPAAGPQMRGTESILLVEDSPAVCRMLARILEQQGYQVTAVLSAEEALATGRKLARPADLLITDVVLPGMNGVELAEQIHGLWPAAKILLMSGYTADAIPQGVADLGLELMQKPFGPLHLIMKVREALDQ